MSTRFRWLISALTLLLQSTVLQATTLAPLHVLPLVSEPPYSGLQPSGLAYCKGKLLMVSDRHNHTVFQLELTPDVARVTPYLQLFDIPKPDLHGYDFGSQWWANLSRRYDWEGISCDQDYLYLLSETLSQVLIREPTGRLQWSGDAAYQAGRKKGLFEQINAKAEGLAVSDNGMYIAAERHPRGIVKTTRQGPKEATAYYLNGFPNVLQPQDFSGLVATDNALYTLERNHYQVCKRTQAELNTIRCWSYEAVEKAPQWRYRDQRFGKAEGIAFHQQRLFIVMDNNEDFRQADPQDNRPLLMVFKLPTDW